jgi:short subunit dehydrogenase-like uncharacterized protein
MSQGCPLSVHIDYEMSKTVTIYGATAFTAGPVIEYLDNHPDASQFKLILSGRNLEKLDRIQAKLNKKVEIVALELSDEEGVKSLVDSSDVIINVAGKLVDPQIRT